MRDLVELVVANPLYGFAGLVGLAVGIFYGFDGWRGDATQNMELKDSPRVKNLLWILGPGILAFLGDVKALDPDAKRPLLLLMYFLACLVALFLVVGIWGCVIAVGRSGRGHNYGYSAGDALGDYFFYGYRYYRNAAEDRRKRSEAAAATQYARKLSDSIIAAVFTPRDASIGASKSFAVSQPILRSIAELTRIYHGDDESLRIRVSLMILRNCDESLRRQLAFVSKEDRPRVRRCLQLVAYDEGEEPSKLIIPVSDALTYALPGGPRALLHPDGYDIIDDTSKIAYSDAIVPAIRGEMQSYFNENSFKSSGSLKITVGTEAKGVVNVYAQTTRIFGESNSSKGQLAVRLRPFATTLAILIDASERRA